MPNPSQDWMRIQDAAARRGDSPQAIEGLRQQYFQTRIAPKIAQMGGDDQTLQMAAQRFDAETKGKLSASQNALTPDEQSLASENKSGGSVLGAIKSAAYDTLAPVSIDTANAVGGVARFIGDKTGSDTIKNVADYFKGNAAQMEQATSPTYQLDEGIAKKAQRFTTSVIPLVASGGAAGMLGKGAMATAAKYAIPVAVGAGVGYDMTKTGAQQELAKVSDDALRAGVMSLAQTDPHSPAVQLFNEAGGDMAAYREAIAQNRGNRSAVIMAALSPFTGLGGMAAKALATRGVGRVIAENLAQPTIAGAAKRVALDAAVQGGMNAASMGGAEYVTTNTLPMALGRERTPEENKRVADVAGENFVMGALAAPALTAAHVAHAVNQDLGARKSAAASAASELNAAMSELPSVQAAHQQALASGNPDAIAQAADNLSVAQQNIAAQRERLRTLNADESGNLLDNRGGVAIKQQPTSLTDVANNAQARDAAVQEAVAPIQQQADAINQAAMADKAKRGLIDLAEQGDLQGLRQSAAGLANGDENAYNALMDGAFTGAKLRKDAATKAASDAQKAQATDAALVEKAKQHIAKSGGDLVDAAMRMRAANKSLTPAQASEYVTRAHMDLNRPAMEQANAQEAASAARPVNGIAGYNEQPTGNIIDGTAIPIDYGPDIRPSVSTQAAIDRSPARASPPAPTAQDRLPSPDSAGAPSIKPDTVIQVGPEGTAMPRPARTIQEEARQRKDTVVPSGTKARVERPARADQRSVIGGEQMPGTIQEAAKAIAPTAKAEQTATGMEVEFGGKRYPVDSLADASAKWQEYVGRNNLGVSDVGNGVPVYSGGKQIARVSYNGRLWDMHGNEIVSAVPAVPAAKEKQPKTIQQAASEIKPEVNASAAGKPTAQPKKAPAKPVVDPERDNLLVAIAKLGGIDRAQAKAQGGFDPAEMNRRAGGLLPIFRKTGGQNLDRMAEMLHERGYPVSENGSYTVNGLLDAVTHAMRGGDVGTPMYHERKAQAEYEARQQEQDIPFDEPGTNWVDAASDSWMTEAVNNEIKPDAVAASELRSIEDEQRKPSAPGASGQEADTGAKTDSGQARAGEAVAGREGGKSEGQGVSRQGAGGQAGELTLESYTDADLAKRAEAIRQQQDAEKRKAESERLKAQADRELKDFRLSGSSAPADVAMAGGQKDMFAPKTRGEREAEKSANSLEAQKKSEPEATPKDDAESSIVASEADFPTKEVARSYDHISRSGNALADGDTKAFVRFINDQYADGMKLAETDEQNRVAKASAERLRDEYLQKLKPVISTRSVTYSGMVAGRSRFNSKQAGQRGSAYDRALESFTQWLNENKTRVVDAVIAARSPEQLRAIAEEKEAKAAAKKAKDAVFLRKLLDFKKGDNLEIGNMVVERVNRDRDGYPSTITFRAKDGSPLFDNKADLARILYRGDKDRLRKEFDDARAGGEAAEQANAAPDAVGATEKQPEQDTFDAFAQRLGQGKVTLDEFKRRFDDLTANKDTVMAELSAKTKDQLLSGMGPMKAARYRNDKKDAIVRAAYSDMLTEFTLHKSLTYGMDGPEPAVRRMVDNMTEADLTEYASRVAERRKEIDEARKNYANALENPQSLEDYRAYIRAKREGGMTYRESFLSLNPDQREKYDALEAEATKKRREERQRSEKTRIEAAQQKTRASIVETKHTQKGHDLFVVKLDDRVDRDSYNALNAAAKRLGGYYSSYRAGGAVPGFQFTERANAEAFSKLVQGDTTQAKEAINEKRDAFEDNKAQSAADRLDEMAQRLEETADTALSAERKTNTARRARFADAAMREAYAQQAMAKTMRNLSESIRSGSARFLGMVRQKAQIETLNRLIASAHENYLKDKYKDNWYSKRDEPVTKASADHADFQTFTAWKSDLATLGRQLMQIPGAKRIGETLAKTADDVTDDYLAFARENIPKVSHFRLKDGTGAVFSSKEAAENAIYKSGLSDRAIVLPVKRGENRIILSPKAAADLGVWNSEDKRITLKPDFADELVVKMAEYPKQVTQLHGLLSAKERIDRLKGMGIETPTELRAALREYIGLKEEAKRDKIREMELSMVGRQNDGLDFFPTPEATVDRMVEEADIKPGMSVLEPEAGMGHIADRLREAGHEPEVMEISPSRRELLLAKGYRFPVEGEGDFTKVMPRTFHTFGDTFQAPDGTVGIMRGQGGLGGDRVRLDDEQGKTLGYYNRDELTPAGHRGTASGYDRIIMNPPFSNRQDVAHVMHAYDHLADGGRLVAIVGEGVFNGSDAKAVKFREWLSEHGARIEKLDAGTFNDPSLPVTTQANARMVVIDKKSAPDIGKGDARLSTADRESLIFAADFLNQLSDADEAFRYPTSDSKSLPRVMEEVFPEAKLVGDDTRIDEREESGADKRTLFKTENGATFHVYERGNDVWIDVSKLKEGERGAGVYAAVGNYAHNAGKVFIGDPAGLSEAAVVRRTNAMLSLALRFGGTDFMEPAKEQLAGDPVKGIAPLEWRGDDLAKIRSLIDTALQNIHNKIPGLKDGYRYDFAKRGFIDRLGRPVDAKRLGRAERTGDARAARAGEATLRRGILLQSLVSSASGERPGILEQVLRRGGALGFARGGLDRVFSPAAADRNPGIPAERARQLIDTDPVLSKASKFIDIKNSMDDIPSGADAMGDAQSPEGYYHNGKVALFADNIAAFHNQSAEDRLKWVAFHELTHRGVAKLAESREYLDALDRAGQNPFIKNLAARIMAARKGSPYEVTRSIATEEALAEVSAALQTGDVSHLKDRYGLNFPESIRTAAKTAMQRFFEVVKRIFNRLTGRGLTDQQVGELLGRTMKAGLEQEGSAGEAASGPAAMRYSVIDDVKDRISEEAKAMLASDSQLSLLNRTLGTKLNIALRIPAYKAVHDKVRAFLNHTNVEAFEAVNKAPELLARNEDASDYKRELKRLDPRVVMRQERDIAKTAKVIYENTLRADAENKKVFTDAELRAKGLNDDQIRVYRTFMDAVNVSLDNFAKANITRLMMQAGVIDGDAAVRLHNRELPLNEHLANLREQAGQMAERLQDNINSGDDSTKTARELDVVKAAIDSSNDIADKANRLKAEGYAPAMRFGEHTVTAYDESGRVAYFEGFDSKTAAIRAEKAFKEENPKWRVVRGTMSQEKYKQFQGLTPETVALFAKEAGYDKDPAYQEYLKLAINNSSPLKRMIHRKGIAGFSQDLPRVLASFVMSNARGSSRAIFAGQMQDALTALKQAHPHDGRLYDDAAKLVDYVQNPKEEAQFIKNMLFHFYLAGSFGFGLVNLLQPLHMTSAQIARYNGGKATEAFKAVAGSYKRSIQAMRTGQPPKEYAEAFKKAQREGYLDPANTYALQGIERGRSGYAHTWLGAASHALSSIARITETINRTSTFIAAMDFAKQKGDAELRKAGFKDAYDFATRAIDETQGVYDKSNRPNAARGAVGSLLMAYKMYPINFIEFGARMAKEGLQGNPGGYAGLAMLLGVLAVTSGVTGLPLAQDLLDALEGIFAGFGHPFNSDRFMREHLPPEAADVLMHGIGAAPGVPLDLASRMSMGSQIPGLPQLVNPMLSDDDSHRAGQQLGGAAENMMLNFYDAYRLAFGQGKYGEAVVQASPKWARSVAKAFEMASKGEYTDSKGRKVRDVTPIDAIVKALDIQPASISRQQRLRGVEIKDMKIQQEKTKYFADRMVDAAISNDSNAMLQAQSDVEKWNRDNPLYQVSIDYQRQVARRVIDARKGPAQRLKTPKEMRWIQGEAVSESQ